jgi:hypothetical protein
MLGSFNCFVKLERAAPEILVAKGIVAEDIFTLLSKIIVIAIAGTASILF